MLDREENRTVKENNDSKEFNRQPKEYPVQKEMSDVSEMKLQLEDGPTSNVKFKERIKKDPKLQQEAFTATAVIGLASFAVIATSGLVNVTMDGTINEITYQDNKICYNITVEDVHDENTLFFEVLDGSVVLMTYTIELEYESGYDGDLTGSFSIEELNLQERMNNNETLSFDVHLCGDTGLVNRTYDSWVLEVTSLVSKFDGVAGRCDHENSGYYLFTMDFQDDYSVFSEFEASITDKKGNKNYCTFSPNLHDEQKIWVLDLSGGEAVFELLYKSNGELQKYTENVVL